MPVAGSTTMIRYGEEEDPNMQAEKGEEPCKTDTGERRSFGRRTVAWIGSGVVGRD